MSDTTDAATADTNAADAEAEAPEVDERRQGILDALTAELGDAVVGHHLRPNDDLWIRVTSDAWARAGRFLQAIGFDYFCFLSAIDWMPSPYGRGEDDPTEPAPERSTEIKQGYAGGDTRFQVFARLADIRDSVGVTLKTDVANDALSVPTWSDIFAGANWHERETHEMFGIGFDGHPDLRNMYLPSEFEGHPLRKDFPLLARIVKPWPGIVDVEPMPADESEPAADAPAADAPAADAAATDAPGTDAPVEGTITADPESAADPADATAETVEDAPAPVDAETGAPAESLPDTANTASDTDAAATDTSPAAAAPSDETTAPVSESDADDPSDPVVPGPATTAEGEPAAQDRAAGIDPDAAVAPATDDVPATDGAPATDTAAPADEPATSDDDKDES